MNATASLADVLGALVSVASVLMSPCSGSRSWAAS